MCIVRITVIDNPSKQKVEVEIGKDTTITEVIESVAAHWEKELGEYALYNPRTNRWLGVGDDPVAAEARGWQYDENAPIMGNQPITNYLEGYVEGKDELFFRKEPQG